MSTARPSYAPLSFILSLVLVALGAVAALADTVDAPRGGSGSDGFTQILDEGSPELTLDGATSAAGVVPTVMGESSPGGNVTCAEVDPSYVGSSGRVNHSTSSGFGGHVWQPDGLSVQVLEGTSVSWSMNDDGEGDEGGGGDPIVIAAVIVKGGPAAHVYDYGTASEAVEDSGLVAPANASGRPAELSNLTFCWGDPSSDDDDDDGDGGTAPVSLTCAQVSAEMGNGPFTRTAGPMSVVQGVVDQLDLPVGTAVSIEQVEDSIEFVMTFSTDFEVELIIVTASAPTVLVIEPATSGQVTLESEPSSLKLCGNGVVPAGSDLDSANPTGTNPTGTNPSGEPTGALVTSDPTTIPTGGGPSGRSTLAMLSFVILSMVGSTSMLLWARGGGA